MSAGEFGMLSLSYFLQKIQNPKKGNKENHPKASRARSPFPVLTPGTVPFVSPLLLCLFFCLFLSFPLSFLILFPFLSVPGGVLYISFLGVSLGLVPPFLFHDLLFFFHFGAGSGSLWEAAQVLLTVTSIHR